MHALRDYSHFVRYQVVFMLLIICSVYDQQRMYDIATVTSTICYILCVFFKVVLFVLFFCLFFNLYMRSGSDCETSAVCFLINTVYG